MKRRTFLASLIAILAPIRGAQTVAAAPVVSRKRFATALRLSSEQEQALTNRYFEHFPGFKYEGRGEGNPVFAGQYSARLSIAAQRAPRRAEG